jgi:cell division protein FtsW
MLSRTWGLTLIILVITVTMFYVAGASIAQMTALAVTGFASLAFLATAAGYRADRLSAFFSAESDPQGNGFQTLQSLIAIGNGGIHGLGLGASRGKFFYIPESHTDGVFALWEELGILATSRSCCTCCSCSVASGSAARAGRLRASLRQASRLDHVQAC